MNKLAPSLLVSILAIACSQTAVSKSDSQNDIIKAPKNIIMIVGDGMGPAYTSAYRYFNDDPKTDIIEQTIFDRHHVGNSSTYPARISGYITDSAAGATALATATKTYNGAIGVDVNKQPVESVLVWAKKQGKKTGMVVTSQINHATPASYLAHNESRHNYNEIADSYVQSMDNIDLLMGGGWKYFIRKNDNLVDKFKSNGFHYLDNYQALDNIPNNKKVLGLFADGGLPWALDDTNKHRLSVMAKAATKQLENSQGYFLLIEASQVDWGGHSNDITDAMAEMDDLAKTMEFLESYVAENPDTLVVLTADHSTGGFTLGQGGDYIWDPTVLRQMTMSPEAIGEHLAANSFTIESVSSMLHFAVTAEEITSLNATKVSAPKALMDYAKLSKKEQYKMRKPTAERLLYLHINQIIDQRTTTGWTTVGHTGVDVPVFALGQGKEVFSGQQDNIDIANKIFTLLGKK
jgi:alkaline phosphatase